MGRDSNNKPTAMQSRSMARSDCWTTVSKRTGSLSAPDVNSTGTISPEKSLLWVLDPGPFSPSGLTLNQYRTWLAAQLVYWTSSLLVKRKSWKVRMDPGRDPTAGLISVLIVAVTVNIWHTKRSGPFQYCCIQYVSAFISANVCPFLCFFLSVSQSLSRRWRYDQVC